ncbi:alpha/beta hydrolase [Pseudomonas aeruginosa]
MLADDRLYRVIAVDQVGFSQSSKAGPLPVQLPATGSHHPPLMEQLGAARASVIGHSMGGMLATRYALLYPRQVERRCWSTPSVWRTGRPLARPGAASTTGTGATCRPAPKAFANTSKPPTTPANGAPSSIAGYRCRPACIAARKRESVAWNSALTYDMIFTQPVVYELDRLQMPTLLLIGEKDNTAIGKDAAPAELKTRLGNYAHLGRTPPDGFPRRPWWNSPTLAIPRRYRLRNASTRHCWRVCRTQP